MTQVKKFNPLEELSKSKKVQGNIEENKGILPQNPFQQATRAPEDPPPSPVLDTTTKAVTNKTVRRFDLNDLPQKGAWLYPHLKKLYPHMDERMYTGWIRSAIADNACHFVRTDRTVALAFMAFRPMNPVCFVDVKIVVGDPDEFKLIYDDLKRWGESLGASHIEQEQYDPDALKEYLPGLALDQRVIARVFLK